MPRRRLPAAPPPIERSCADGSPAHLNPHLRGGGLLALGVEPNLPDRVSLQPHGQHLGPIVHRPYRQRPGDMGLRQSPAPIAPALLPSGISPALNFAPIPNRADRPPLPIYPFTHSEWADLVAPASIRLPSREIPGALSRYSLNCIGRPRGG